MQQATAAASAYNYKNDDPSTRIFIQKTTTLLWCKIIEEKLYRFILNIAAVIVYKDECEFAGQKESSKI